MHPLIEALRLAIGGKLPSIIMTDSPMGHLVPALDLLICEGVLDGQSIHSSEDDTLQGVTILGVPESATEYLEALEALCVAMN